MERYVAAEPIAGELAALSEERLSELFVEGEPMGSRLGGRATRLKVAGHPVFAKKVGLTDLERAHFRSTANLYDLPLNLHYGVGSVASIGFGPWRELAAQLLAADWVRTGASAAFPLLYHWRILPDHPSITEENADPELTARYWEGSAALRRRLEDERKASASLVLFLEYLPLTVWSWLNGKLAEGDVAAVEALERQLLATVEFMNSRGLIHFDAHFQNILTDGVQLYFTDFGLVGSPEFEQTDAEAEFLRAHRGYDRAYVTTCLASRLVSHRFGAERCDAVLREYASRPAPGLGMDAIIHRGAPVAVMMREFIRKFRDESRQTPYPAEELEAAFGDQLFDV